MTQDLAEDIANRLTQFNTMTNTNDRRKVLAELVHFYIRASRYDKAYEIVGLRSLNA